MWSWLQRTGLAKKKVWSLFDFFCGRLCRARKKETIEYPTLGSIWGAFPEWDRLKTKARANKVSVILLSVKICKFSTKDTKHFRVCLLH